MGEQRPALPAFPGAMSALTQTLTGHTRWHPTRVTAAVLCFVAVVLVIVSSFLPLYEGRLEFGSEAIEVTVSPWSAELQGAPETSEVPRVGYPLVFAAVAMALAAATLWYAATPTATPGAGRLASTTAVAGAAFLTGAVWTTALLVINGVDSIILLGSLGGGLETEASYLAGHWLLVTAAVLSLAAAVLALIPVRRPGWPPPAAANPNAATPPYGIALPVAATRPPPPRHQVDPLTGHPVQVDPFTGQPFQSPPAGLPAQPYPPSPPTGAPMPYEQPPSPPAGQPALFAQAAAPPLQTAVDPLTGRPLPPAPYEAPQDVAEPLNGTPAPIVVPEAPPAPRTPPGPAVPPSEDPLAEPPRG